MRPVLSREQIRSFDARAIEAGVPGLVLMENAGRGAAEVALRLLGAGTSERGAPRVLVLCGGGNNGGDGYVVARRLHTCGVRVQVLSAVAPESLAGDALIQARAWAAVNQGGPAAAADVAEVRAALDGVELVVDALLGTGANRPVRDPLASWIATIDDSGARVLALDVPSGLDADSGAVLGVAVRAHTTVTFAHYKRGLFTTAGHEHAGEVVLVDIGVPGDAFPLGDGRGPRSTEAAEGPAAYLLEETDVTRALRRRPVTAHKGQSGRVVVVAGSPGKVGAARLTARGALRAGAGLVTVATREEAAAQLEVGAHEEMTERLDPAAPGEAISRPNPDAIAVGPGLGLDDEAWGVLEAVLRLERPAVVDADALHLLALRAPRGLDGGGSLGPGPRVLTPHPGEAARLLGVGVSEVEGDRFAAVRKLCAQLGAIVVLKGSRTLVAAPDGVPRISCWGSPVLATGGTGDVLTGIIGALLVHYQPLDAAWLGVALHGAAGELRARGRRLDRGILAREIADGVPRAVSRFLAAGSSLPAPRT